MLRNCTFYRGYGHKILKEGDSPDAEIYMQILRVWYQIVKTFLSLSCKR